MLAEVTEAYLERELTALQPEYENYAVERIQRDGVVLYVWMRARRTEEMRDLYVIRLDCRDYPERASDITFVDPETLEPDVRWWPKDYVQRTGQSSVFRTFPGNLAQSFVCATPFLAWQTHGHAKPAADAWTLVNALHAVFQGLNVPEYAGYCR
jgi:hypothetical protein